MRQLVMYYSLVMLFKIKMEKKPLYIYQQLGVTKSRNTRAETERVETNIINDTRNFQKGTQNKTFIPRTISDWNSIPVNLRQMKELMTFKKQLRIWIMENVPVK